MQRAPVTGWKLTHPAHLRGPRFSVALGMRVPVAFPLRPFFGAMRTVQERRNGQKRSDEAIHDTLMKTGNGK